MRIYSDRLTFSDINSPVPSGMHFEAIEFRPNTHAHGYEVHMSAEPGTDEHGIKRCYSRNSGVYGANREYTKAPTWVEWGDLMVEWFKIDPDAKLGPYNGAEDFVYQTDQHAPFRPKREQASRHAERWANELDAVPLPA